MYAMSAPKKTVTLRFTLEGREAFRTAYDTAVAKNEASFEFLGYEFVVGFARHLLVELDQQLGPMEMPRVH